MGKFFRTVLTETGKRGEQDDVQTKFDIGLFYCAGRGVGKIRARGGIAACNSWKSEKEQKISVSSFFWTHFQKFSYALNKN